MEIKRLTVELPQAQHRQVKVLAAQTNTTVSNLVRKALSTMLGNGLDLKRPHEEASKHA